jgi:hypothetical protein
LKRYNEVTDTIQKNQPNEKKPKKKEHTKINMMKGMEMIIQRVIHSTIKQSQVSSGMAF